VFSLLTCGFLPVVQTRDPQALTNDLDFLQGAEKVARHTLGQVYHAEKVARHTLGQVYHAVIVVDFDAANMGTVQHHLVGQSTNDYCSSSRRKSSSSSVATRR